MRSWVLTKCDCWSPVLSRDNQQMPLYISEVLKGCQAKERRALLSLYIIYFKKVREGVDGLIDGGRSRKIEEFGAKGHDQGYVGLVGGRFLEGVIVEAEGAEGVAEVMIEGVFVDEDIVSKAIVKFLQLLLIQEFLFFPSGQQVHLQEDLIVLFSELFGKDSRTFHHHMDQSIHLLLCQAFFPSTDCPSLLELDILLPSDILIPLVSWIIHHFVVFFPGFSCIDKAFLLQCLIKEINKYSHDQLLECLGGFFTGICVSLVVKSALSFWLVTFLLFLFLGWPASIFADLFGFLRRMTAGRNLPRFTKAMLLILRESSTVLIHTQFIPNLYNEANCIQCKSITQVQYNISL